MAHEQRAEPDLVVGGREAVVGDDDERGPGPRGRALEVGEQRAELAIDRLDGRARSGLHEAVIVLRVVELERVDEHQLGPAGRQDVARDRELPRP